MARKLLKNIFSTEHKNVRSIPLLMQLPLYLFVISALCIISCYFYKNHSLIPFTEKRLQKIAYETENTINSYLKTAEKNADSLAELPLTKKQFALLSEQQNPTDQATDYHSFILSQQESMDFKNILLINKEKVIRYAATTKNIVGKQLTTTLKNTLLSLSYERAMMSLTTDFSEYGHNPLFEKPTLFISVPVIENKKFIGILAYECNVEKIIDLTTNQYTGLGETGEIVLAQENKNFILYISPSRHDPDLAFKRKKLFNKNPLAIQPSVLGGQGTGIAHDYRSVPVVGAWTFIPKVNWGLIAKIDVNEARQPLQFILILFLINIFLIIMWIGIIEQLYFKPFAHFLRHISPTLLIKKLPSAIKNIFFFISLIVFALLIHMVVHYHIAQSKAINEATQNIMSDINSSADEINLILNKITFISQSIADDLKLNRLSKEDLIKRMKRDLAENDNLVDIVIAFAPYKYKADTKLYAPTVYREDDTLKDETIEEYYDYTDPDPHNKTTAWYRKGIQAGYVWLDTYIENSGEVVAPSYSLAFFDDKKELQGIICVSYSFEPIKRIAAYSSLERKGFSFLLSENGQFISHPIKDFVSSDKTLLQYAYQIDNKSLVEIAEKLPRDHSSLSSYIQNLSHTMWIYTEPIQANNWILGTIFSKDDISLSSATMRLYSFWIVIYSIITLLCVCIYLYSRKHISIVILSALINLLFICGLLIMWHIIQTSYSYKKTDSTIITDQTSLDKFLDDLQEETTRKHEESPIKIPCGLMLYSLDMPHSDHMTITGYIWTKYNTKIHKDITHQIVLPHATRLVNETPTTATDNDWETVTWNMRGTIYEKQHYNQFPFDKQQMQITLEHHDIDKNIILVPDLEDYKKISPEDTPGLDKSFTLSEFNVEETFFIYKKIDPVSNFGFAKYGRTTDHFQLIYNLVIARGLLGPFVLYFLPFLVILFSLFSVLMVAKRDTVPLNIISPYTGLFFALVLLHRSLREQYPTGATLYIEFGFFFAYITIILLVIHTMLTYLYPRWEYYQKRVFPLAKLLFWPLQLASWLITTFIIFY